MTTAAKLGLPLHDGSLGFMLVYAIPGLLMGSAWLGTMSGYPDLFLLIPLVIGYILVPIAQDLWPRPPSAVPDEISALPPWQLYYHFLPLLALPLQLAMLYVAGECWSSSSLDVFGRIILLITTGLFSAMFAINVAHELIHRRQRFDRWMGGLLLSTVSFGTFKAVHTRIHHRHVGTPRDFATARRGQSIYGFWRQSLIGYPREALRCERAHLARRGRSLWSSELLVWYGFTGLWLCLALLLWGPLGGIFFLSQSVIAILKLDCINYLQHYGLTRKVDAEGRAEPVRICHSWSQGLFLHDLILLNLLRHGDHHVNPRRPYQALRHDPASPEYPHNYAIMLFLLLIPPLFRRVVHPRLDHFTAQPTPGETL